MPPFRSLDSIENAARKTLLTLYADSTKMEGGPIPAERFFPVDLKRLLELLGWRLDEVSHIDFVNNRPIQGRCILAERRVEMASDAHKTPEEWRYTLAHEIGHIVLRHLDPQCMGELDRVQVRSVRRPGRLLQQNRPREEAQAQRFAADLLMPIVAVRDRFRALFGRDQIWVGGAAVRDVVGRLEQQGADPNEIKWKVAVDLARREVDDQSLIRSFGVSAEAMARRLIERDFVTG